MSKPAIFFDRDGTIIEQYPGYLKDPNNVKLIDGVIPALKLFQEEGFLLVIISNQSGIGRGLVTKKEANDVHIKLISLLGEEKIKINFSYYCPHKPEDVCHCRKPSPTMIYSSSIKLDIDLKKSYMIGDQITDIKSGMYAGCKTVLFNNKLEDTTSVKPDFMLNSWEEIAYYTMGEF